MKKYQSEALKVIHQDAEGLHRLGIISDKKMQEYDQGCLVQGPKAVYSSEKSPKTEYAAAHH
ncbi:hypothetical protein [Treponema sp. R80B11-R83G3]